MKKYVVITIVLLMAVSVLGCGKKKETLESMQEPMSIDAISAMGTDQQAPVVQAEVMPAAPSNPVASVAVTSAPETKLDPLPPQGPYKPSPKDIQTALKNAGFYTGGIDGKIGPMTKKAIEDFQKAKGLQVDGKVGPKTWEVLSPYLATSSDANTKSKKR